MNKKKLFLFVLSIFMISQILEVSQKIIYAEGLSPITLTSTTLETNNNVELHAPIVVTLSDSREDENEVTIHLPQQVDYLKDLTNQQQNNSAIQLDYQEATRFLTIKWNQTVTKSVSIVFSGNQISDLVTLQAESQMKDTGVIASNQLFFAIDSQLQSTINKESFTEFEHKSQEASVVKPTIEIDETKAVKEDTGSLTTMDEQEAIESLESANSNVSRATPRADLRDVSSHDTLNAALADASVTTINVVDDFTILRNITTVPSRPIIIEGNNHTIDFRNFYIYPSVLSDITVKKLNILGVNYYGPINFNGSTAISSLTYEDVNYTGSQMMASYTSNLFIRGTVISTNVNSYTGLDGSTVTAVGSGQQNVEAASVTFLENSNYTGTTINCGVFRLTNAGNFTVEKGAVVTLNATGSAGGESYAAIDLTGDLLVKEGGQLTINIASNRPFGAYYLKTAGKGIELQEGAAFVVQSLGNTLGNAAGFNVFHMNVNDSFIKVGKNAKLDVQSLGTGSGAGSVVYSGTRQTISVAKDAELTFEVDGTGAKNILWLGNNADLTINDAKKVEFKFVGTPNTASRIFTFSSTAGKLNAAIQKVSAWNRTSDIAGISDYTWNPMFDMIVSYSAGNVATAVGNSVESTIVTSFANDFKTQNFQRLLFEQVPDIQVSIDNSLNDNPIDSNSQKIEGTTSPNAYVSFSGDVAIPVGTLPSPVIGATNFFHIQADSSGHYSYPLPNGSHLTVDNVVTADAFLAGKTATASRKVLDKTPPVVEVKEASYVVADALPDPADFIQKVSDSNPNNSGFTTTYVDAATVEALMNQLGNHQIFIDVADSAGNSTVVEATLRIFKSLNGIDGANVTTTVNALKGMDQTALKTFILNQSQPTSWNIVNKTAHDLTSKITISDLGGITSKSGKYQVTLFVSAVDANLPTPLTKEIEVTVENTGPTSPTNPTNPGSSEADDRENDGTGNTGTLRLDYAPSKINFGKVPFSFKDQTVYGKNPQATSGKELLEQWVQVSDDRMESNGWSVRVSQSGPFTNQKGEELTGAVLTLPKGTVYNQNSGSNAIVNGSVSSNEVVLSTSEVTIFSAADVQSVGKNISTNVWQAKDVSLKIKGGTGKPNESYENTINWSLVSGVSN